MSNSGSHVVRDAVASDAEAVARVHVDAWQETYSGVLAERHFSEEAFSRRKRFWTGYLSLEPRPGRMVVAERGGVPVGFANAGEARGPDAEHGFPPARSLHLFSIYLLAAAHGSGSVSRCSRPCFRMTLRNCGCFAAMIERSRSTSAMDSQLMVLSSLIRRSPAWLSCGLCDDDPAR